MEMAHITKECRHMCSGTKKIHRIWMIELRKKDRRQENGTDRTEESECKKTV